MARLEGYLVDEFIAQNATMIAIAAVACALLSVILLVLLLLSRRNTRLLSYELDDADDRIDASDRSAADQAARLGVVRELHDVAVHSVATIVRQADAARYISGTDAEAPGRSIALIAATAAETLATLRRIVTVSAEGQSTRMAPPTLDRLAGLVDRMRARGLDITYVESGEPFVLQKGAEVAIFRIVEEALTNALTFGGAGTDVKVSFTWTAEGLQILVDDDGVQAEARRQGVDPYGITQSRSYSVQDDVDALTEVIEGEGISEMRQRTATFGGVFGAYSVPGVGFSVSAIFPALRYDNGVHGVNLQK